MGLFSKKSAPQPSARPEYIEVGQIVNTHGVRGEVTVYPTTDDVMRFKKLDKVILDLG